MNSLENGASVGRYRVLQFLGSGAMGEVYLAEDPQIERRLAIKTVRLVGRAQEIEDRKRRLLREARAAGRLLHPNVVTLFDAGEQEGLLFLAFELVEGTDLAERLEAGPPLSLRDVLRIIRQTADALDYAHKQGIVHRDIKPSNILLDTTGRVKVADFGIAKVAGQSTELTVAGSVMGSPQYLSPEQIRGEELDGRTDIFSLGVVLYELLSRTRPFNGETITTLVYQILHMEPPPISDLRSVPPRLEALLRRMLAKSREERFATAGEIVTEVATIERELSDETLSAPASDLPLQPTRVMARQTGTSPPAPPAPPPPPAALPPPSRAAAAHRSQGPVLALVIAAGVLFLAVVLAGGWYVFFRKPKGSVVAEAPPPAGQTAPVAGPGMSGEPATGELPKQLPSSSTAAPPTSPAQTGQPARGTAEPTPSPSRSRTEETPAPGPLRQPPTGTRPQDRPVLPPPASTPAPQRPVQEDTAPAASPGTREEEAAPVAPAPSQPSPEADQVLRTGLEVAFRVMPPDAFVLVDRTNIGRAAEWSGLKGNRTYTLDAGEHLIKIRSQGMKEHRILVQASATGGVTPINVRLRPLAAETADVTDLPTIRVREAVAFRVEPPLPGIGVLVDGQPAGLARQFAGRLGQPRSWLRLEPGVHRISLAAPGFQRQDFKVEVTPGAENERERIEVRMTRGGGS